MPPPMPRSSSASFRRWISCTLFINLTDPCLLDFSSGVAFLRRRSQLSRLLARFAKECSDFANIARRVGVVRVDPKTLLVVLYGVLVISPHVVDGTLHAVARA